MTETVKWLQIEAECGGYRQAVVAVFRKYKGEPTDEKDAQGRTVKVTSTSFARHVGIPEATFRGWLKNATRAILPSDRDELTEAAIRRMGAEVRMGIYEFVNALWAMVDEELVDYPEARERMRRQLDVIRRARGAKK